MHRALFSGFPYPRFPYAWSGGLITDGGIMPLDLRKVVFSNEELQAVLVNYFLRNEITIPDTSIDAIEPVWEGELMVRMHFLDRHQNRRGKTLHFGHAEVAAALILYCRINKEPLPKAAMKMLEPAGDGIVLCLRFPWGDMWNDRHPGYTMNTQDVETEPPLPRVQPLRRGDNAKSCLISGYSRA